MNIEIVISKSFGVYEVPKQIKEKLQVKDGIEYRIALAKEFKSIEDYKVLHADLTKDEMIKRLKNDILQSNIIARLDNNIYFKSSYFNNTIAHLSIVTVDTTIPWKINDYDGAESIKYLDLKLVNEKYNLYEW